MPLTHQAKASTQARTVPCKQSPIIITLIHSFLEPPAPDPFYKIYKRRSTHNYIVSVGPDTAVLIPFKPH